CAAHSGEVTLPGDGGQQGNFHHIAFAVGAIPAHHAKNAVYSDQRADHVRSNVAPIKRSDRCWQRCEINNRWDKYVTVAARGGFSHELSFNLSGLGRFWVSAELVQHGLYI